MPPYRNYIYEYHAKITSGEIIAGKWIKKIYEIIINGLQKQEYFFNAKAANKAIRFIENFCHHSKGRNDLIKLELWQKAIVSVIFGIQDAEKIRIFREIFIVIGRKNGKSLFASAIIAYMAYLEPEYGQEIYCLAPKLDQAALVYDGFYQMVQAEDELAELAKKRRSDIYIAESNTVIKPIAFNAKKSDGFNPQLVVCDEMAAWSGDAGLKQYEVMKSALGARTQPMILSISTAGYINDSIYDELMKRSTSFLKGNSKERRLLPFLYMIKRSGVTLYVILRLYQFRCTLRCQWRCQRPIFPLFLNRHYLHPLSLPARLLVRLLPLAVSAAALPAALLLWALAV